MPHDSQSHKARPSFALLAQGPFASLAIANILTWNLVAIRHLEIEELLPLAEEPLLLASELIICVIIILGVMITIISATAFRAFGFSYMAQATFYAVVGVLFFALVGGAYLVLSW